jgi:hypothetical protein
VAGDLPVVPLCRISPALIAWANHWQNPTHPALNTRGVSRSSQTLAQEAMDVFDAQGRSAPKRTAKSCGLDASTLALSWRNDPPAMVTRKPDRQREHEGSRKTIACGNAG